MKEIIYIVAACQEYKSANHKNLWSEFAKFHRTVVVDIPADYVVSNLKKKRYRIVEAKKGPIKVSDNLFVVRPLFLLRHELVPYYFRKYISKTFWKSIERCIPEYRDCKIRFLSYDGIWNRLLDFTGLDVKIGYYLYDEVRHNGDDNSIDKKRYINDEYACENSDVIFTMTKTLTESRKIYNDHILTVGNGSLYVSEIKDTIKIPKSVAFVGNFRNWVDNDLLEGLIAKRQDVIFAFAGNIEADMEDFFWHLLNTYDNVLYMGKYTKERMSSLYTNFNAVIIPYRHNEFIQATRPIKIVESVMAGTPVVTVPMTGYEESKYVRFADTVEDFSMQIDYLLENPIDKEDQEYNDFVKNNTWASIAKIIEYEISK